jgi:hypothetical protein
VSTSRRSQSSNLKWSRLVLSSGLRPYAPILLCLMAGSAASMNSQWPCARLRLRRPPSANVPLTPGSREPFRSHDPIRHVRWFVSLFCVAPRPYLLPRFADCEQCLGFLSLPNLWNCAMFKYKPRQPMQVLLLFSTTRSRMMCMRKCWMF